MKTKNIFKTLALAMLMPTMLLTTACSNQDDVANTSNITNKGYALPVTVNVTRGDDGATRASFNGSKLNFSDGDKLFVEGSHIKADRFAGTLTWQSGGTFSGTIYTESPYGGTIDDLLNGNYATLLPAGYGSYDYLEIMYEGYEARLGENAYNSFATSKKLGVEQLSFEHGEYTSGTGFVLEPQNAILNFTITGLAASTNVTATLSDDDDWTPDIEGEVTTDGSGTATFAIGLEGSSDLNEFSLTVGGKSITLVSSSKTLEAGKIYNITRAVAPAPSYTMAAAATTSDKGKLICTAGHIHVYGEDAACTAGRVAKIIYVGTNGHATYNHGLALALEDMSTKLTWDNSGANNDGKTAAEWCSAWNTSTTVTDAEWLLASKDQWDYMLGTNGAGSSTTLRDGFESVGGTNMKKVNYWSSTENGTDNAWNCYFGNIGGGDWYSSYKNYSNGYNVRACLAF